MKSWVRLGDSGEFGWDDLTGPKSAAAALQHGRMTSVLALTVVTVSIASRWLSKAWGPN